MEDENSIGRDKGSQRASGEEAACSLRVSDKWSGISGEKSCSGACSEIENAV